MCCDNPEELWENLLHFGQGILDIENVQEMSMRERKHGFQ